MKKVIKYLNETYNLTNKEIIALVNDFNSTHPKKIYNTQFTKILTHLTEAFNFNKLSKDETDDFVRNQVNQTLFKKLEPHKIFVSNSGIYLGKSVKEDKGLYLYGFIKILFKEGNDKIRYDFVIPDGNKYNKVKSLTNFIEDNIPYEASIKDMVHVVNTVCRNEFNNNVIDTLYIPSPYSSESNINLIKNALGDDYYNKLEKISPQVDLQYCYLFGNVSTTGQIIYFDVYGETMYTLKEKGTLNKDLIDLYNKEDIRSFYDFTIPIFGLGQNKVSAVGQYEL